MFQQIIDSNNAFYHKFRMLLENYFEDIEFGTKTWKQYEKIDFLRCKWIACIENFDLFILIF